MQTINSFFETWLEDEVLEKNEEKIEQFADPFDIADSIYESFREYSFKEGIDLEGLVSDSFIKLDLPKIIAKGLESLKSVSVENKTILSKELILISTNFLDKLKRIEWSEVRNNKLKNESKPLNLIDPRPESEQGIRTRL